MLGITLGTFYTQISSRKILSSQRETTGDKTKTCTYMPSLQKAPTFPLFLIFETRYCYIFASSTFL